MTTGKVTTDLRVPYTLHGYLGFTDDQWTGCWSDRDWTGANASRRTYTWKYLTHQDRTAVDFITKGWSKPGRKRRKNMLLFWEPTWKDRNRPRHRFRVKVYDKSIRTPNAFTLNQHWIRRRYGENWYNNALNPSGVFTTKATAVPAWKSFDQIIDANKMNNLVARLGQKVNGNVSFNPGIFLGEGKQSLRLLGGAAVELAGRVAVFRNKMAKDAIKAFKGRGTGRVGHKDYAPGSPTGPRGEWQYDSGKRGAQHLRDASDRLLEVQYGWRPLINDVYEGAQWVASKFHGPKTTRFVVRTQKRVALERNTSIGIAWATAEVEARAQIIAYLTEDFQGKQSIDLNLATPAQIAWELMPWSFVIDWAVPIGEWLEARGAAFALTGTFVTTKTEKTIYDGLTASTAGSPGSTKTLQCTTVGAYDLYARQWRTVSTSLAGNTSFPGFKGFKRMASWEHCLNGVALLLGSKLGDPRKMLNKIDAWRKSSP